MQATAPSLHLIWIELKSTLINRFSPRSIIKGGAHPIYGRGRTISAFHCLPACLACASLSFRVFIVAAAAAAWTICSTTYYSASHSNWKRLFLPLPWSFWNALYPSSYYALLQSILCLTSQPASQQRSQGRRRKRTSSQWSAMVFW